MFYAQAFFSLLSHSGWYFSDGPWRQTSRLVQPRGGMELRWTGRETPAYDVKGVQTHTHTRRGRGRGQPTRLPIPHGLLKEASTLSHYLNTLHLAKPVRDLFIFIPHLFEGGKKEAGHLSGNSRGGKKTTSRSRKTRSCRIKDRRWMLLVLL